MRSPSYIFTMAGVVIIALLCWQVIGMCTPNRDDADVTRLKQGGVGVTRWSRCLPLTIVADYSDHSGDVQGVFFKGEVTDEQVEILLTLKSCELVSCSRCSLADRTILVRIAAMKNLNTLKLHHHSVTDQQLTDALPHFQKLKFLYLQDNDITDASVEAIANVPHLHGVCIAQTKITTEGIARLRLLRPDLRVDEKLRAAD